MNDVYKPHLNICRTFDGCLVLQKLVSNYMFFAMHFLCMHRLLFVWGDLNQSFGHRSVARWKDHFMSFQTKHWSSVERLIEVTSYNNYSMHHRKNSLRWFMSKFEQYRYYLKKGNIFRLMYIKSPMMTLFSPIVK